jgi:DNA-binding PadR family transcriptional regulator
VSLEYILLGLLGEPRSGYELKAVFDRGVAHFWPAELSQIYVNLKRMAARGWLRSELELSDRGPDRRVYARTEAGSRALREWLAGEPQIGDERYSYLAQLFLLGELEDPAATRTFLLRLRERLAQRQAALRAIDQSWREREPGYPDALPLDQFHQQLTLDLGLRTAASRLAWCDAALRRVKSRAGP